MTGMRWILTEEPSGCAEMWWRLFRPYETDTAVRVEFFGDEIDRITEIDMLTGEIKGELEHVAIFPASHYVVPMSGSRRRELRRNWKSGCSILKERTSFWKPSGSRNGRILISRC